MQSYTAPACGATTPSLPALIERLQNIHLLSLEVPAGDYALHRQVAELTHNVANVIGLVDSRILDATNPATL